MICGNFLSCLENTQLLEQQATKGKSKKKRKNKKEKAKPKIVKILSQPVCGNSEYQNKCIVSFDCRSKPSCTENGKTYTINQADKRFKVMCYHIDGGVIDSCDCNKCDYAFFIQDKASDGKGRAIFIELKGGNVRKAVLQLKETLSSNTFNSVNQLYKKIYGRIVVSSCKPDIRSTDDFLELEELLMKNGGNLKIKEFDFEELYADLDRN